MISTPHPPSWQRPSGIEPFRAQRLKRPSEVGGLYVLEQRCFECHSMTVLGERANLQNLTRKHFPEGAEWLRAHQPALSDLNEKDAQALMSVLRLVADDQPELLYRVPKKARFGAHFFFNKACIECHRIDGQGGEKAEVKSPDLTLRLLRPKEWHLKHIHDPRSLVLKSEMPPFLHYEPHEYDALVEYILYLHTP